MPQNNDLAIEASKFAPSAISDETRAFNQSLMDMMAGAPRWYEVGAERYREMRKAGETPLPAPVYLDTAESSTLPSRDPGRPIPCRFMRPQNGKPVKAVYLHIHGGGWVLGDEKSQDTLLREIANRVGVLVISVGYRLAPEHPFPAGPNDCYDVAEWLVDNAESTYGAPLGFIGGDSAGAHLSLLVALHLLQSPTPRYAAFRFRGLILHYGCFSMSWTPQVYNFQKPVTLVLDREAMDNFNQAFLPGMSDQDKRDPSISPLYAQLEPLRGKLPPALFTCGTEDCLLDDTMFMSTKWLMAGAEAVVKIVPGAPHGYTSFPPDLKASGADQGMQAMEQFVLPKLG